MHLVSKDSQQEIDAIKRMAGEAFANDNLFKEFGVGEERYKLVRAYMWHYVDYVLSYKALYANDDISGAVALMPDDKSSAIKDGRLLRRLKKAIPKDKYDRFMEYSREVTDIRCKYRYMDNLEMLMLCVSPDKQGQGLGGKLIRESQQLAASQKRILLIDTENPTNSLIYQHEGCTLYGQKTASNGVTRYNLIWRP